LIFELWHRNFLERRIEEPGPAASGQVASLSGGKA
jgi:hypothetical protein